MAQHPLDSLSAEEFRRTAEIHLVPASRRDGPRGRRQDLHAALIERAGDPPDVMRCWTSRQ